MSFEAGADLSHIPGLRIDRSRYLASGDIGAVAVACKRIGSPFPELEWGATPIKDVHNLREYQIRGVLAVCSKLKEFGAAILADEMGLGKTRQAIAISESMGCERTLICCPASVRETWREELIKYGIKEEDIAVCGPKSSGHYRDDWKRAATSRFIVSSYDYVNDTYAASFQHSMPSLLILDEGHLLKGRSTKAKRVQRCDAAEEIATLSRYKLILSATPVEDRPRDWWRILKIILGGSFGSAWDFDIAYCGGYINEHGGMDNRGATRQDELRHRLSYYTVRRLKSEVSSELPVFTRQVLWVEPDAAGRAAFNLSCLSQDAGALAAGLRATLDAKIPVAVELAVNARRFLLLTYLKAHAREIGAKIQKEGVDCVVITGDMDTFKRNNAIRDAIARQVGVVATIDSVGTGVDGLQYVASFGIMHAFRWVPNKMVQAEGRIHRLGSKDPVQWTYIACQDTMDAIVMQKVINKLDAIRSSMPGDTQTEGALRDSLSDSTAMTPEEESAFLREMFA